MAKRARRQRNQLPNCYYEGFLEKKSLKDETPRKLWTCLCGNSLFFFNDKRDTDYIEKMDLCGFVSITDDQSKNQSSDADRLNLQMKDGNIKLTVPNAESRELWKGYIRSVAELRVPPSLNLLPGQIHMLNEAVEQEKQKLQNVSPPADTNSKDYICPQGDMPACYHNVSRLEATLLLEKEANRGNMLLRPGSNGNSFAITTRQDLNGPVVRHYRVTRRHEGGFLIDVDSPVPCATLHDVVTYFVGKTDGVLMPLITEGPYEKNISFIWSDNENGERSVQPARPNGPPPELPQRPGAVNMPPPEPEPEPEPEAADERLYLNDSSEEKETGNPSALPKQQLEKKPTKKAPPIPTPRKIPLATLQPLAVNQSVRVSTGPQKQMPLATLSELKLKLEQKAKCQE
ncbi:signal-transducing adaptor protein 1-like [Mugil cephalus]|uniref:signal-transducing adaptor protein 1-like n=1 Tax=Mugil cephalus TaxID=48193 RepID=UPI001FB59FE8|nr:signal-transducing adaptor protein 1-like [Mugil cephalus]